MRKTLIPLLLVFSSFCFSDTLVLKDGTEHQGTLQSATTRSVTFKEGTQIRRYMRSDIQAIEFGDRRYSNSSPQLGTRDDRDRRNDNNGTYNNGSYNNGANNNNGT